MLQENYRREINPEINIEALRASAKHKHRRQMLLTLALMLIAGILVIKYGQSWFDSILLAGAGEAGPSTSDTQSAQPATATSRRGRSKQAGAAAVQGTVSHEVGERAVLAPLQVEVIYGSGRHKTIRTRDSSINLNLQHGSAAAAAPAEVSAGPETGMTDAADRVRLSPETVEAVARPVEPKYPPVAKQMNVQGAVVLLAHIDKDGNIQDLQVLSGPDILAAAAQEAVRQWRFRPHMEKGRPVATEARVTVNFTISTH